MLFHIPADFLPLRRVISNPIWDTDFLLPAEKSELNSADERAVARAATAAGALGCGLGGRSGAPGGPAGHLFCTTGYTGRVKIWDDRFVGLVAGRGDGGCLHQVAGGGLRKER